MSDTKIKWALYRNDGTELRINRNDLDEDLYNQKYRGKLFCINGCEAKMKFTHRSDEDLKFFSTWNKEGLLHDVTCPYLIEYKGTLGRKKLEEAAKALPLSEDHIKRTIRNKFKSLKLKLQVENSGGKTTREINNIGQKENIVYADRGDISIDAQTRVRIGSLDANLMTHDYVNLRKCIFGRIKHAFLGEYSSSRYIYLNLDCREVDFSVYLPEAFYSKENNNVYFFEQFYNRVNSMLNLEKDLIFVGVGFIKEKNNKNGMTVHILDKDHFMINESSYDSIRLGNDTKGANYSY